MTLPLIIFVIAMILLSGMVLAPSLASAGAKKAATPRKPLKQDDGVRTRPTFTHRAPVNAPVSLAQGISTNRVPGEPARPACLGERS
jgi:hypothetical protein